jgi:magnesium transporter
MPELSQPAGYPILLGAMLVVAAAMILYFRKRGWIGKRDRRGDAESTPT